MFSITCTTCHARLKVRDESTIGSILPCPKCGSLVEIVRAAKKSSSETPTQKAKPAQTLPPVAPPAIGDDKKAKAAAATAAAAALTPPSIAQASPATQAPPIAEPPSSSPAETGATDCLPASAEPATPTPPPVAAANASTDTNLSADAVADAGGPIPNWTSPTELMWRKWLVLIGSPLAAMVVTVGVMSVFFSSDATTNVPTQDSSRTAATDDDSNKTASHKSDDNATIGLNLLNTHLLPRETRVILSLTPAELAGQSGVERLLTAGGPLWTSAIGPALEGLGLELGQISRVTLGATDAGAITQSDTAATCSLVAIQLEPHVDLKAIADKGQSDSSAWPHPHKVLHETKTVVTGPAQLLREVEDRSATDFASRPISRLLENINPESNLIVLADVEAGGRLRYMQRAKRLFAIWPAGRKAWKAICETPSGVGLTLRWSAGIQADVALACPEKSDAERLDSQLAVLLPAARTALAERIKRLSQQVGSGEVQPLWADRYETFLKHTLSAIRPIRRDIVDDVVLLRSSWDNDPVSTALTSLDAVEPTKTDWLAAGQDCDRNNQQKLLAGLKECCRAEGSYPAGAVGGALLPPETRLSWLATLLPYQDRREWHGRLQFGYPWNSDENTPVTTQTLPTVVNPALGSSQTADGFPVTHYVGVAGLGKNAGTLSPGDPKAGVFGFRRHMRPQDIADGAANTIAVLGVSDRLGPWSAGGHATVRGLTQRPYINGPDGFGSGQPHGMLAGMADGSTRFISKDIDPRILEQMVTTHGGHSHATVTVAENTPVAKTSIAKTQPNIPPAVEARLRDRIERIEFREIPLAEVISFLQEFTAIKIEFDDKTMNNMGVSQQVQVTVDLAGASVSEILTAVLSPHELGYTYCDGRLLITGRR